MFIPPINKFYGLGTSQATSNVSSAIVKPKTAGTAQELIEKLGNVLVTEDGKLKIPQGFDNLPVMEKDMFFKTALAQKESLKK